MAGNPFPQLGFGSRLPVILQVEAAECGLACLAMVAGHYRLRTDLATLRNKYSLSMRGATLKSIIEIAKSMKLASRPLKLDLEHLGELKLPCILHWDMNHFVVLRSVSRTGVVIHDPAVGRRSMGMADFGKHFTGVALELSPAADFAPAKETQAFSMFGLMGRVSGLKRGLSQIMVLAILLEIIAIVAPLYMQWVVDHVLVAADRSLLSVLGMGFLLLVLIQTATGALRSWAVTVMSSNLNLQWQGNVFSHLLKLPLDYFEKRHLGDIVSRFGSISAIQKTITAGFVQAAVDGLLVVGTFVMMFLYSGKLAAIAVLAVAGYVLIRWLLFRPLRAASAEQIVHAAKQQTHFLETARGIQSVRLFGRDEERRMGWMNLLVDQFNADIHTQRLNIVYQAANTALFGLERVAIIWLAALAVLEREFSAGMLFAFIAYKDQFSSKLVALVDKVFEWKMLRLHGERVADIVLTQPEEETSAELVDMSKVMPAIEVRGLTFRYSPLDPPVLRNLNLSVPAGQILAITGVSGSGKTTLVKILLGLLKPSEGEVLVGGLPVSQVGLRNYRSMIGSVMQDDTLFMGSIADNISFFDPMPSMANVENCARLAACHAEIMTTPMGFNTLVGDIGSGMSGGQKQRILLARALYKDPSILVLDEATSHLDMMNEKAVNEAIKSMQLTRILVAHRAETINTAERVVVLHQGQVAQDVMLPKPPATPAPVTAPKSESSAPAEVSA
jgi:ATP-binding cassette subfamily B protein RaxB